MAPKSNSREPRRPDRGARDPGGGPPIAVEIHALAAGGDAVGRDDGGRAVFVAGAAPGELVQVRLRETHARWARGDLAGVTRASPSRVLPPCPLFASRACGGCQWQHVDDATQQAQKQQIVAGALRKLVAAGMELRPFAAPVAPYGWRRRARFAVHLDQVGMGDARGPRALIGFHEPRGHDVCDVPACPQLDPALEAVLVAVRAANLVRGDGELHAIIGAGTEGTLRAHVVIDAPCDEAAAAGLVGQAGIAGVAWRGGSAGAPAIEIEPGLFARGDGFAQASRAGNDALRAFVRAALAAQRGERVLELYAGAGNFTRDALDAGALVVATDIADSGASQFVVGAADAVTRDLVARGETFDAVLLDPPRTGARDVVTQLAALRPSRIVYVSCDPATFARDAEHLVAAGYAPRWAQALDLMPQTSHVELVARFERT
ncbi:MAG TPA: TRAM domain-containing protein [Kofleriaceae bacterium]|nr:TRAM domain-containing protein [Kofleriaceae bacterium]